MRNWCGTARSVRSRINGARGSPLTASQQARQAHNLKVIGSNPIPATKLKPARSITLRAFAWAEVPKTARDMQCRQIPNEINAVSSCATSCPRVHVTRMAHGEGDFVRRAFRQLNPGLSPLKPLIQARV